MHVSQLILNPQGNLQVQRDLASPYEMHRTILRAFPSQDEGGPGRMLFRTEPQSDGRPPVVLVQSDKPPDWSRLAQVQGYLLSAGIKTFEPALRAGQRLRFRLRANPSARKKSADGRRVGIFRQEEQAAWLERKARDCGFRLLDCAIRRSVRQVCRNRKGTQVHQAVDFEGVLQIVDPAKVAAALATGIGPAKGFGFGLLSLAPC